MIFPLCSTLLGVLKELLILVCSAFHLLLGMELNFQGLYMWRYQIYFSLFMHLNIFILFFISSLILLWSEKIVCIIFIFFNLSRIVYDLTYSLLWKKLYTQEKTVHSPLVEWSILYISVRIIDSRVVQVLYIYSLIFCLGML